MLDAFVWWIVLSGLGAAALPITLTTLRFLPDRGFGFSRPIGLLLVTYLFWLLGLVDLVPNSRSGVVVAGAIVLAVSSLVLLRRRRSLGIFMRRRWAIVLASEFMFAAVFAFWALMRSYTPDIVHTEQPMDFALLNGILGSAEFPPQDPWFAGEPISYYYLGYLMNAGLTQLTGIVPSVAYNLAIASTAGMAATAVMSVVFNIVRGAHSAKSVQAKARVEKSLQNGIGGALVAAVVGVILFLFMGNLVGFLEMLRVNDIAGQRFYDWVAIDGLTGASTSSGWYPEEFWWWFRSTRVINSFVGDSGVDFTITEFPFFSFMLGDLHPHVMALPFTVVAVGLAHNVLLSRGTPGLHWLRTRPLDVLLVMLLLGSLGFLNSWDLPTFIGLFLGTLALRAYHLRVRGCSVSLPSVVALMVLVVVGAVLLYSPFYPSIMDSQASGILPVRRSMTRPIHFIIVLGPLVLLNLSLVAALTWRTLCLGLNDAKPECSRKTFAPPVLFRWVKAISGPRAMWAAALTLVPFAFWAATELSLALANVDTLLQAHHSGSVTESLLSIGSRFWHLLPLFLVLTVGLTVLFAKARSEGRSSASLQLTLLAIIYAFLLIVGADLFHIADHFGNRMNTVFKFYYQAWMLLAVGGAVSFYYWVNRPRVVGLTVRLATASLVGLFTVVVAAGLAFGGPALYSKTDQFRSAATLDGLQYVRDRYPFEYAAVEWLRANAKQGDVIVEASPGTTRPIGDYDPAVSRISQRTGLATILGWPGHEHQWRGNPFDPILSRHKDVGVIYRDGTSDEVMETLARYGVTFVVVGNLERRTYGRDVADRFEDILDTVFENRGVVIYERRHA